MLNPEFEELEKCFTACLELEDSGIPMSEALNGLKQASNNLKTHWDDQWKKHNIVKKYLVSKGILD